MTREAFIAALRGTRRAWYLDGQNQIRIILTPTFGIACPVTALTGASCGAISDVAKLLGIHSHLRILIAASADYETYPEYMDSCGWPQWPWFTESGFTEMRASLLEACGLKGIK